jgi:hypothetical protein
MAGPSVVVRVLGDLRGLGQSMAAAGSTASQAASRAQQGFGKMLGTLNASGALGPFGAALGGINDAIGNIISSGKKIGPAMIGAGAAVTGVGALLSGLGSHEQAAHQQLHAAIDATGHDWGEYGKQIDGAIKKGESYGHGAAETMGALQALTQATHNPAKALQLLGTTFDLSAAKHVGLTDAASSLGKVYNGNTRLLKQYGINVAKAGSAQAAIGKDTKAAESADRKLAAAKQRLNDLQTIDATKKHLGAAGAIALRNAQTKANAAALEALAAHHKLAGAQDAARISAGKGKDAISQLGGVLKGQASASADTFAGKLAAIRTRVSDSVAMFGQKYGPALQAAGLGIMALGTIWSTVGPLIAAMELASLGPILLIAAGVVALIAVGYLIYRNWSTIWGAIQKVIQVVWDWVKTNWPLLLAIIVGPVALAAYFIWKHFDRIKQLALDAVQFIERVWDAVKAWFSGLVTSVGSTLSTLFDKAKSAATTVVSAVKTTWTTFETWLTGLPARLVNTFAGMFDGISAAFKAAINWVIGAWNSLHFKLGGWTVGKGPFSVTLPTVDIGMPTIPKLAQGGLVTQSGLIFAHAGEAITPLPRGRLGPIVHIEHAHFTEPVDVDVFTQHIAALSRSRAV